MTNISVKTILSSISIYQKRSFRIFFVEILILIAKKRTFRNITQRHFIKYSVMQLMFSFYECKFEITAAKVGTRKTIQENNGAKIIWKLAWAFSISVKFYALKW